MHVKACNNQDPVHYHDLVLLQDEASLPLPSPSTFSSSPASPTLGTSRRAVLLATDIAGVPSFPDMEGELPASYRSPPASPVIDLSTYDLPLPVLPSLDNSSENSFPMSPLAAMPEDIPNSAALVSQPAPNRSEQPACKIFPIFDKRVYNS